MCFMIRKGIILLISVLYIITTAGVAVNFHYCMDRIVSVSFGHEKDHEDGSCSRCGMNKIENHCCADESFFVKLSDTHQASGFVHEHLLLSYMLPVAFVNLTTAEQGNTATCIIDNFSPPPPVLNKLYLANCVFRI